MTGRLRQIVLGITAALLTHDANAQAPKAPTLAPLPIDVVLALRDHHARTSFAFSPDGRWIAHTVQTHDILPADPRFFSPTGVPLGDGRARMIAEVTDTQTGEEIALGSATGSSWNPTWSPDRQRIAFFSDEGGTAGLWLWDASTRRAARVAGVTARPFFNWEFPRWSSDGRMLLFKALPDGMTVAQANALSPLPQAGRRFPPHASDAPSVLVLRSGDSGQSERPSETDAFTNRALADLVLLDTRTKAVRRIVRGSKVAWYGFAPDRSSVAYTHITGSVSNSDDLLYDIDLADLGSGSTRRLAHGLTMNYGIELSWSPESQALAFVDHGTDGAGALSILPIDGTPVRQLTRPATGSIVEAPPHWSFDGQSIYTVAADGRLLRTDRRSGASSPIALPLGSKAVSVVAPFDQPTAWTSDHGRDLWVVGRQEAEHRFDLLRVDLASGRARTAAILPGDVATNWSIDASGLGRRIAFVASDQHHPAEIWTYGIADYRLRQIGKLNPELDRYRLGDARVISYPAGDGRTMHAALLLPPDFRPGRPVPMVVWVYAGLNGSDAVRQFGLSGFGPTFNMQLLATRGYAVLFPDMPYGTGTVAHDLLRDVMPAVDGAVAQGYADPGRLAVMGQSFGAYSVLALITQTTRFKAAVISASVIDPDLLASYLELEDDGSAPWIGLLEHGQANLGGSPWQYRSRYLDNSPIYDFDKVTTPVLMVQGADDGRLLGPDAAFVALRRLGKEVEYRIYEGEGHVLEREPDFRDFWSRRVSFLADHLSGPAHEAERR